MKLLTVLLWFVSNDLNYRLAEVHDPKVMTYPGDFIQEVRLVWSRIGLSNEKDLCLVMVRIVNFRKEFSTDENLSVFEDYVIQEGGKELKVGADLQGKATHMGLAIGLKYFEQAHQKRMVKAVSIITTFLMGKICLKSL